MIAHLQCKLFLRKLRSLTQIAQQFPKTVEFLRGNGNKSLHNMDYTSPICYHHIKNPVPCSVGTDYGILLKNLVIK
jgi:hypothetical protein